MKALALTAAIAAALTALAADAQAQCAKATNPKRVTLFINTNAAFQEARAAERAACAAGEKFVMIPENSWADLKAVEEISAPINSLKTQFYKNSEEITRKYGGDNHLMSLKLEECQHQYKAQLGPLQERKSAVMERLKSVHGESAKAKIEELAKNKVAIASLVISGHDGGGGFFGDLGNVEGSQLRDAIQAAYAAQPDFKGCPVESVFLWGCYTAVPDQVLDWRSDINCLKVVGGYFGSAPAAIRPASHQLLSQMMASKHRLSSAVNKTQFNAALATLSMFNQTKAAVYACDAREADLGQGWYAANREGEDGENGGPVRGRLAEVFNCDTAETRDAIDNLKYDVDEYANGFTEVPMDTAHGAIRNLYNKARLLQSCNEENYSDRVGLLLFFHGVKEVFAKTFEGPIGEAKAELEAMLAAATEVKNTEAEAALKKLLPIPDRNAIHSMGRIKLLKYMNDLQGALSGDPVAILAKSRNNPMAKSQRLSRLMEVYLNARDTRCMSPWLAWHELEEKATPNIPSTPLCQGYEEE